MSFIELVKSNLSRYDMHGLVSLPKLVFALAASSSLYLLGFVSAFGGGFSHFVSVGLFSQAAWRVTVLLSVFALISSALGAFSVLVKSLWFSFFDRPERGSSRIALESLIAFSVPLFVSLYLLTYVPQHWWIAGPIGKYTLVLCIGGFTALFFVPWKAGSRTERATRAFRDPRTVSAILACVVLWISFFSGVSYAAKLKSGPQSTLHTTTGEVKAVILHFSQNGVVGLGSDDALVFIPFGSIERLDFAKDLDVEL